MASPAIHAGEILADELEGLGINASELARFHSIEDLVNLQKLLDFGNAIALCKSVKCDRLAISEKISSLRLTRHVIQCMCNSMNLRK